jgi:hypothetical protein
MKKFGTSLLLIVFIFNFCLTSCKKKDKEFPKVNFISPSPQSQYKVLETIFFKAEISDNKSIESISISMLDMNSNIIVSSFSPKKFVKGSSTFQLSESIELIDKTISSGEYRIKITASDGELSTSKELKVLIDELPKKREAILFFLKNTNTFSVYKIDSTNSLLQIASLNGNFLGAKTFSSKKVVSVATNLPSQLAFYPFPSFSNPAIISSLELLSAFALGDSLVYFGNRAGYVWGLDNLATQKINFICSVESYFPNKIFESSSQVICVQSNNFNQYFLEVRNKITGGLLKTKDLSFNPVCIAQKNENKIILLKSFNNQSQLIEYDFANNTLSSIKDINENITFIKNLDANILLLMGNSKIYSYNYNSGFFGEYNNIGGIYQMEIDELNNQLLFLKNGQLILINKDSPSQNFIIPLPLGYGQVQIIYNK